MTPTKCPTELLWGVACKARQKDGHAACVDCYERRSVKRNGSAAFQMFSRRIL